jgi:hypothetical protein
MKDAAFGDLLRGYGKRADLTRGTEAESRRDFQAEGRQAQSCAAGSIARRDSRC